METPLIYIECDIPEGMTLNEWRREQCMASRTGRRPRRWRKLLAL